MVDDDYRCIGLITVKDIEKAQPASQRRQGRAGPAARRAPRPASARPGFERAEALIEAGVDVIVVDTAHGHSQRRARRGARASSRLSNDVQVIAGNVATAEAPRR